MYFLQLSKDRDSLNFRNCDFLQFSKHIYSFFMILCHVINVLLKNFGVILIVAKIL